MPSNSVELFVCIPIVPRNTIVVATNTPKVGRAQLSPGCVIKIQLEDLGGRDRLDVQAGRLTDLIPLSQTFHHGSIKTPIRSNLSFFMRDNIVLIVPLYASDGR